MAGKVLNLKSVITPDLMGTRIAAQWMEWNTLRKTWVDQSLELRKYVYATDTTTTTNSKLPWKNKTTIPKLCQIRDNLHSNYMLKLFPKRHWLDWDARAQSDLDKIKRDAILGYMGWVAGQDRFRQEMSKLVLDYIDYGNAFGTIEWIDERSTVGNPPTQVGYVGPSVRRISPMDIVFNPVASNFLESPKIVRSLISWGELKKLIDQQSTTEDAEAYKDLYNYLKEYRVTCRQFAGDLRTEDAIYQVDGFTSFRAYLESEYVEVLTFYGDIFDWENEKLYANHKIMVVDRHKVISRKPNPSFFGYPPIFHVGWRIRQDNLWAMGPLNNLVGMQYRIDHIENLKADVFDLLTFPPLKVKGYVEDFTWGPMERIYTDGEGDVEMIAPPFQILQANIEIQNLMSQMEEIAGAPKEAMGFRSPGEKTAFEVQRMENAANRIFNSKTVQFEEFEERLLNGCLELARRQIDDVMTFPVFDDEFKIQVFKTLTPSDITGAGQIKPMAARHFAEKAEMVQNLTQFYQSGMANDAQLMQHFSSIELAKLVETLLNLEEFRIVAPNIRITEAADAQHLAHTAQTQMEMAATTPSGLTPGDSDEPIGPPQ